MDSPYSWESLLTISGLPTQEDLDIWISSTFFGWRFVRLWQGTIGQNPNVKLPTLQEVEDILEFDDHIVAWRRFESCSVDEKHAQFLKETVYTNRTIEGGIFYGSEISRVNLPWQFV